MNSALFTFITPRKPTKFQLDLTFGPFVFLSFHAFVVKFDSGFAGLGN